MALNALVLYFSPGGNTKKVAEAIVAGLDRGGAKATLLSLREAEDVSYDNYDLVCLGSPSYNFNVPEPVLRYVKGTLRGAAVRLRAPAVTSKWGVVFVTYGGPHSGIDEATPAGDHLGQLFRHLGYQLRGTWYTVGEFHGDEDDPRNRYGYLGDIRGRPNVHDLGVIESNAYGLASVLSAEKAGDVPSHA